MEFQNITFFWLFFYKKEETMADNKITISPTANKVLALFFPPVAVLIRFGFGGKFLINILLTLIGWIPGVIHAFMILPNQKNTTAVV